MRFHSISTSWREITSLWRLKNLCWLSLYYVTLQYSLIFKLLLLWCWHKGIILYTLYILDYFDFIKRRMILHRFLLCVFICSWLHRKVSSLAHLKLRLSFDDLLLTHDFISKSRWARNRDSRDVCFLGARGRRSVACERHSQMLPKSIQCKIV